MSVSVFRSIVTLVAVLLVGSASAQVSSTDTQQVSVSFNVALISASDTAITDVTFDDSTWVNSTVPSGVAIGDAVSGVTRSTTVSYTVSSPQGFETSSVQVSLGNADTLDALKILLDVAHDGTPMASGLVLKDYDTEPSQVIIEATSMGSEEGLARSGVELTYSFIIDVTRGSEFDATDLTLTYTAGAAAP